VDIAQRIVRAYSTIAQAVGNTDDSAVKTAILNASIYAAQQEIYSEAQAEEADVEQPE
jgi:hypothetical protein